MTPELVGHLVHFEGWRSRPYMCAAGKPTIGYGHRIDDMSHRAITHAEGMALLLEDIAKYEAMALRLSPGLTGRRLDAITDFCFNAGGSAYAGSTLRRRVNDSRWEDAAFENSRWVYVTDPVTRKKYKSAWQIKRRAVTSEWLR